MKPPLKPVPLQQLANENRKEAKKNAKREDMKWQVNVEVHDPDIGLVSVCLAMLLVILFSFWKVTLLHVPKYHAARLCHTVPAPWN